MSAEDRALLDRVVEAAGQLRVSAVDLAGAYVHLAPAEHGLVGDGRKEAWELLERVSQAAREAEAAGVGELDDEGLEAAEALLGALAESLLLALFGDERHGRASRSTRPRRGFRRC